MDNDIKIVGIGEGGAKIINKLIQAGVDKKKSVEFIAIGNDENIMLTSPARKNIFLNRDLTIVYKSIFEALEGAKVIFIVAGLAGNAAKSAIPIIMSYAKTYNTLTVVFVCKPSVLENSTRKINSEYTMNYLREVNTLFVVPAEKFFVLRINQPQISLQELFEVADEVFCQGVKILLDLNDFKFGNAAFGYGEATNAIEAIKIAAKFPTLEENDLSEATAVFVHVTSGKSLTTASLDAATNFIKDKLQPDAEFFSQEETSSALGDKIFAAIILTRKENAPRSTRLKLS